MTASVHPGPDMQLPLR